MKTSPTERGVLATLVAELEAEGYDVFVEPDSLLLPKFLGSYRPDIIARSEKNNLIVEIKSKSQTSDPKLSDLAKLVEKEKDWELKVVWVSPSKPDTNIDSQTADTIKTRIKEIEDLVSSGHVGPALLLSWAVFEALGRSLLPSKMQRPQTPGRVIEMLATYGSLMPDEADQLRQLAKLRNALIHGDLKVSVMPKNLEQFVQILRNLANEL